MPIRLIYKDIHKNFFNLNLKSFQRIVKIFHPQYAFNKIVGCRSFTLTMTYCVGKMVRLPTPFLLPSLFFRNNGLCPLIHRPIALSKTNRGRFTRVYKSWKILGHFSFDNFFSLLWNYQFSMVFAMKFMFSKHGKN